MIYLFKNNQINSINEIKFYFLIIKIIIAF
jgi:hypothetical protein